MADVNVSLRTWLIAQSGVNALIGSGSSARCYPDVLDQAATLPAILYYTVSSTHDHLLKGLAGLVHDRVRFECYAMTRSGANALAQACISAGLIDLRGLYTSVYISAVELESGLVCYQDPPTDGNDVPRYFTSFDLMVHYKG